MCIWQRCHIITLRYNDLIEPKWHYITPSIQMEFFHFKTQFVGFQFIDIDNQTPRVDQQNKKKMVIRIYIL